MISTSISDFSESPWYKRVRVEAIVRTCCLFCWAVSAIVAFGSNVSVLHLEGTTWCIWLIANVVSLVIFLINELNSFSRWAHFILYGIHLICAIGLNMTSACVVLPEFGTYWFEKAPEYSYRFDGVPVTKPTFFNPWSENPHRFEAVRHNQNVDFDAPAVTADGVQITAKFHAELYTDRAHPDKWPWTELTDEIIGDELFLRVSRGIIASAYQRTISMYPANKLATDELSIAAASAAYEELSANGIRWNGTTRFSDVAVTPGDGSKRPTPQK